MARTKRRLWGDIGKTQVRAFAIRLGIPEPEARALAQKGYGSTWKVDRASEDELARIPMVGRAGAIRLKAGLAFRRSAENPLSNEAVQSKEFECPVCGCVTSAFAPSCLECHATFDEEYIDEQLMSSLRADADGALLSFYDSRIGSNPEHADLWYARGLLLEIEGRANEAIVSFGRAVALDPERRKFKLHLLRLQAEQANDTAAESSFRSQLQELAAASRACRTCEAQVPLEAEACPECGATLSDQTKTIRSSDIAKMGDDVGVKKLVDELLMEELEESLTPEDREKTWLSVFDWMVSELEESLDESNATRPGAASPEVEAHDATPAEGEKPSRTAARASKDKGLLSSLSGLLRSRVAARSNDGSRGRQQRSARRRAPRPGGLVNGRVNGVVNGRGRVNGQTDHTGRINGLTNGRPLGRISGGRPMRWELSKRSVKKTLVFSVAAILAILVLLAILLFLPPAETGAILIDGSFSDWASVPTFDAATATTDANVQIARYASTLDGNFLYLYASMKGTTFGDTSGYNGIDFFLDADGSRSTGFLFGGLGADYVVETYGGNGSLAYAGLFGFPADAGLNWSARQAIGPVVAAGNGRGLELEIPRGELRGFDPNSFAVAVYADDFRGGTSQSKVPLNAQAGAVLLEAQPLTDIVGQTPIVAMEVLVRAVGPIPSGEAWTVSSFRFNATPGVQVSPSPVSLNLTSAQPTATVLVSGWVPGSFNGSLVQVQLVNASAPRPVTVAGDPLRAYAGPPPAGIHVDGLFHDWAAIDLPHSSPNVVNDSDVRIVRYGAATNATLAFFHIEVAGTLFNGEVPERVIRSPLGRGGGGNASSTPGPPRRLTGEDVLRVYVDLNGSDTAGYAIGGIFADYLLEVRGFGGRITSTTLFAWGSGWLRASGVSISLAKNGTDIEGSIGIGPLSNSTRVVFVTADWGGIADSTPPMTAIVDPPPTSTAPFPVYAMPEFENIAVPIVSTILISLQCLRRRSRYTNQAVSFEHVK